MTCCHTACCVMGLGFRTSALQRFNYHPRSERNAGVIRIDTPHTICTTFTQHLHASRACT